jgi:hypothetical protein
MNMRPSWSVAGECGVLPLHGVPQHYDQARSQELEITAVRSQSQERVGLGTCGSPISVDPALDADRAARRAAASVVARVSVAQSRTATSEASLPCILSALHLCLNPACDA